jgi:hypothetical protein
MPASDEPLRVAHRNIPAAGKSSTRHRTRGPYRTPHLARDDELALTSARELTDRAYWAVAKIHMFLYSAP